MATKPKLEHNMVKTPDGDKICRTNCIACYIKQLEKALQKEQQLNSSLYTRLWKQDKTEQELEKIEKVKTAIKALIDFSYPIPSRCTCDCC